MYDDISAHQAKRIIILHYYYCLSHPLPYAQAHSQLTVCTLGTIIKPKIFTGQNFYISLNPPIPFTTEILHRVYFAHAVKITPGPIHRRYEIRGIKISPMRAGGEKM